MPLKEEACERVYDVDNVNRAFNNIHCILLRYFENSFPIIYKSYRIECYATNQKGAGSIPAGVSGFFIDIKFF